MKATLQRATLRTSRLLDFASEKELVAQTGHQIGAWPLVILKELVDNGMDACEEAGITPSITVTVDDIGIAVADNGPGLPPETVTDILDFAVRVSSREAFVSPTRGAQGNALKTIVAMPFVVNGEDGSVEIEAQGVRHRIEMSVDRIRQEPIVALEEEPIDSGPGTKVTVRWPDLPRSIGDDVKAHFLQIALQYGWLNPHLALTVDWCGERNSIEPTAATWKKWLPSNPTSAHWYTLQHLERLIAGYIANDADEGHERTVRELIGEFRGLSSTAKQKIVLAETDLAREPLSRLVNGNDLDRDAIAGLLNAMQRHSKPVKPNALGTIGKEHLRHRFADAGCEMDSFQYRKVADTTEGVPWIVETAFGWAPDISGRLLITGVNWSPGIINPFRELGSFGQSLDTILSQQRVDMSEPVIFMLHMACPRVEYTDRGKSAVVVRS